MLDLSGLQLGRKYGRPWLAAKWGFAGPEAIIQGCVLSEGRKTKILLFVTRIKQKSLEQFNDYISGEICFGRVKNSTENDQRIVRAGQTAEDIHLFYREIHHSDFEYKGLVELIDHKLLSDEPSKFVFRLFHDQSARRYFSYTKASLPLFQKQSGKA